MSNSPLSPTTIMDFLAMFPDEDAAENYLFRWRWPDGFICPAPVSLPNQILPQVEEGMRWVGAIDRD